MHNQFKSISLSYKTAPLAVREQVALSEVEAKSLMLSLRETFELQDLLVVSTCNRTEIYYASPDNHSTNIVKMLLIQKGLVNVSEYLDYFQITNDHAASVRYLFEVALGLHSKVVGDLQIPNQIKHAYQWSADMGMAGPFLHRLMHTIFFTNKRVTQETSFRDGAASTSYATVELIEELTQHIAQPKVLIVGLGEIGTDVCKNLADKAFADITVTNRTLSKAQKVADGHNFKVAPYENLVEQIAQADVVVSSVRMDSPLITKNLVGSLTILTFKYFIDLSVPRSVAHDVEDVAGVLVYNIDGIQKRADEALQRRLEAIPQVHALIDEALVSFDDWSKEMVVSPTIQKLKNALEQIRKEELARYLKNLTPEETEKVDKITQGMIQKILKLPVLQLKAACKRGEAETLIDVLNDLFNLETQEVSK
ncbi:MAG: glutamyl-tRNA reductase [Spirosomataceae bacterium]